MSSRGRVRAAQSALTERPSKLEVEQYAQISKLVSMQQFDAAKQHAWILYTAISSSWGIQRSTTKTPTQQQERKRIERITPLLPHPENGERREALSIVVGTVSYLLLCIIQSYESGHAPQVLQDCATLCAGLEPWIRYFISHSGTVLYYLPLWSFVDLKDAMALYKLMQWLKCAAFYLRRSKPSIKSCFSGTCTR